MVLQVIKTYQDTISELVLLQLRKRQIDLNQNFFEEEKKLIEEQMRYLRETKSKMEESLRNLEGIEEKLYYEIVVNHHNVTRAIDIISLKEGKDVSTLWRSYYPNVKKELQKLEAIFQSAPVLLKE